MNIENFCTNLNYTSFKTFNKKIQDIFYKYALLSKDKYKEDIKSVYLYRSTSIIRFYKLLNNPLQKFLSIKVLVHGTRLKHLDTILKYGILNTKELYELKIKHFGYASAMSEYDKDEDWKISGQFFGSYTTPIIKIDRNIEKYYRDDNSILLLIDPYILNRDDWHINKYDMNGELNDETYSKNTMDLYFKNIDEKEIRLSEIIFHNKIQPEFIKCILTHNKKTKKILKNYKYNISVKYPTEKLQSNYYDDSNINLYKNIIGNNNYFPRFCYSYIDQTNLNSFHIYIKIAINCGMSIEKLIEFLTKCKNEKITKNECIKKLFTKIEEEYEFINIENNTYLYPFYEPPFINELPKQLITLVDSFN